MESPVPWFPIWGFQHDPIESTAGVLSSFVYNRPNDRWGLMRDGAVASDRHAWAAWSMLRRLEIRGDCLARSPDTEFLRIVAGTGQISEGIKRAGLAVGSGPSWIYFLPLVRGESPLNYDEISTEIYNQNSSEALHLISSLGGELLPRRPVPSQSGLAQINGTWIEGSHSTLEESFLSHLSNSIIN